MQPNCSRKTISEETSALRHFVTYPAAILLCAMMVAVLPPAGHAARTVVGPQGDFPTVEDAINGRTLSPGDTIQIAPGTFTVQEMLKPLGSGSAGAPIVVRGAGMGSTVIDGSALSSSKALWDVEQGNRWWIFEDMTVSGMRGSQTNARGFFLVGCEDVVLQRLEVTDCWNGIMSANGSKRVTLQYSNIHHCGGLQGPAHNIYMNSGEDFLIQHNWLHDAQYGMCYKDRTHNLTFRYNLVDNADIEGYEISLAGDGSGNQGETLFLGNVFIKSPTSAQQTHLIRFENGRAGTFRLVHNTIIAQPNNVVISSIASTTTLQNNLILGGKLLSSSGAWAGSNNWLDAALEIPAALSGSLRGSVPGFASTKDADYHLVAGSPCIDAGDPNASPLPQYQWGGFGIPEIRSQVGNAPDIGAYEYLGGIIAVEPHPWGEVKSMYR